jgi:protein-S-isoprenylcysteine O-methyltransferase Ste14
MPPVYFLVHLLGMLGLHFVVPVAHWIDYPWNMLGVVMIVVGAVVTAASARLFDRLQTAVKPFEAARVLVVEGAYRYSRNPMYLGMILTLAGFATVLGTLAPLLALPSFVLLIATFVAREEQLLEQQFGPAYLEYKRGVRRWL